MKDVIYLELVDIKLEEYMKFQKKTTAYAAVTVAAIIFGFSFLFTKSALDSLDIFQLLGFRFLTAALFLTCLKATGMLKINIDTKGLKELLMVATLQPVVYFIFETIGVNLTSASESGIMISLVPISVTLLAVFMLKERLQVGQWISIAVSVSGVILIVLAKDSSADSGHLPGVLALIGAVVAAGFYNVLSRKISSKYKPIEITFVMMWVGAIVFNFIGITASVADGRTSVYFQELVNINVLLDIVYLGIISSVTAFFLLNYSLSRLEASKSAVFLNLTPIISVFAGILLRGEKFYLLQCLGAVLILVGIWGTNRKQQVSERENLIMEQSDI